MERAEAERVEEGKRKDSLAARGKLWKQLHTNMRNSRPTLKARPALANLLK